MSDRRWIAEPMSCAYDDRRTVWAVRHADGEGRGPYVEVDFEYYSRQNRVLANQLARHLNETGFAFVTAQDRRAAAAARAKDTGHPA